MAHNDVVGNIKGRHSGLTRLYTSSRELLKECGQKKLNS
jgi:hypothetical protein